MCFLRDTETVEAVQPFEWLIYKIKSEEWSASLVDAGKHIALDLARKYCGRAACDVLSLLRLELNIYIMPYDLTLTTESIAISLAQNDNGRAAYKALVLLRKELGHYDKPYKLKTVIDLVLICLSPER